MTRRSSIASLLPLLALLACDASSTAPVLERAGDETAEIFGDVVPGMTITPFMPYPDGYRFSNYGGAVDWDLFSSVFGGNVAPWSIFDWDFFINVFARRYGGGQCYGFGVTAAMFYKGDYGPHPSFFQRGAEITYDIPQQTRGDSAKVLDEDIERHISKYHFFQYSQEIRDYSTGLYLPEGSDQFIAPLEAAQAAAWEESWVLFFQGDWGGHVVNVVGVRRTTEGVVISIYDNNNPYREDTNNPGVREFLVLPDQYVYGSRVIEAAGAYPASPHERDFLDKWWGAVGPEDLWEWLSRPLDPDMFIVHIDEFGRRLGRTASAVFDDIPDAFRVRSYTGAINPDWVEPEEYRLPPGPYSVELMNSPDGTLAYQLFAGDVLFSVDASGQGAGWTSIRSFPDRKGFVLQPQVPLEIQQLRMARALDPTEERAMDVGALSLPADASLSVVPTAEVEAFDVILEGATGVPVELTLTEASSQGRVTLPLTGIQLEEGASVRVEPWNWSRLAEMPVQLRTRMASGEEVLKVHNVTPAGFRSLLDDLVGSEDLPNRGIANSIWRQAQIRPRQALENHLGSLVSDGVVSQEISELILATVEAMGRS